MTPPRSTPATPDVATPARTGAPTRAATATRSGATGTRGAVSIVGVGKTFDGTPAVSEVSLQVGAGEFVSLLGPSGCGKTTLLRMIAGFERPTTGDIRLDGVSVIDVPPERRPVNTVFQSYALFPHMTVAQNVAFGLRQRKVPRADVGRAVADSLAMVRMADFAKRKPATLSGGQQQRVALARALANRPDVLLLDEPMSALDRKLREEMQVELKLLQRELGITFVFVTHDQEEALSMSDRIVVMSRGQVAQIGDGRSIYARPTDRFVADFIGKQNFLPVTGGSGAVVQTGEGSLHVAAALPGPPDPATQPVVAVRPEQIWLSPEHAGRPAQPDDNAIDGVVGGIGFLGDVTQVVVTTAAGREILVRGATRNFPPLTEGQPVTCYFAAADTTFYPA